MYIGLEDLRHQITNDIELQTHLTMVSSGGLDNVCQCCVDVLENNIPGDFIEAGIWRGGTCIYMRGILKEYNSDKVVWCADSFQGLPDADPKYPADVQPEGGRNPFLVVPLDEVKSNFERFNLLDNRVRFLEGWFKDTLPSAPIESLSILRLDGDLYESTMDSLNNLYHKLSVGGYIILDDYGLPGLACKKATDDFRKTHGINEPIIWVDETCVYWQKER